MNNDKSDIKIVYVPNPKYPIRYGTISLILSVSFWAIFFLMYFHIAQATKDCPACGLAGVGLVQLAILAIPLFITSLVLNIVGINKSAQLIEEKSLSRNLNIIGIVINPMLVGIIFLAIGFIVEGGF